MTFQSNNSTLEDYVFDIQGDLEAASEIDLWPEIEKSLRKRNTPPTRFYHSLTFFIYLAIFFAIGLGAFLMLSEKNAPIPLQTFSDYYALEELENEYRFKKEILLSQYKLSDEELFEWQAQIDALAESRSVILHALQQDPDSLFLIDMLEKSYVKQLDIIEQIHQAKFRSH